MSLITKTVELKSVGLVLTLSQSNWVISRKKDNLEQGAKLMYTKLREQGEEIDDDEEMMAILFYPVLAAGVVSDNCPTVEQCTHDVSEEDIDTWYATARELNPHWFSGFDAIVEQQLSKEKELALAEIKKVQNSLETISGEKMPEKS